MKSTTLKALAPAIVLLTIDVLLGIFSPDLTGIRFFIQCVFCSTLLSYFLALEQTPFLFNIQKWLLASALFLCIYFFKVSKFEILEEKIMSNIIYVADIFLLIPLLASRQFTQKMNSTRQ